jgi:hypothetical protein
MKVHVLKTWPLFFDAQASGEKTFEVRRNDREFEVGDVLVLRRWNPTSERYEPGVVGRRVSYITSGPFLPAGFCAMSTVDWREVACYLAESLP